MHIRARDVWEHPVRPIKWGLHRLEARKKKDNTLNAVEARSAVLLARTKNRDVADCIELSFYTGVRQNELMTVLPSRVNLAARTMVVLAKRKAKQEWRERTVYLNTVAVALLAERLENSINDLEPIFRFKNGRKIWDWVRPPDRPPQSYLARFATHTRISAGRRHQGPLRDPAPARTHPCPDQHELHPHG